MSTQTHFKINEHNIQSQKGKENMRKTTRMNENQPKTMW